MEQEKAGLQKSQKKEKNQTIKSKTRSTTEPPANKSELMRQVADQLKTVFIVGLLCLWLSTLKPEVNVHVERGPWLPWLIVSVLLFSWVVYSRKKVRWPKLRWVFPFAAVALLWLMYLLSGVSFPTIFFTGLAVFLLAWTVLLLLTLVLIMTRWRAEGKLGKTITCGVKQGDYFYWQLSVLILLLSVVRGWTILWDVGMRGWWMDPLLYLGVLVFIVVGLVYPLTSRSGGKP